jgi:hypothetical protein
MWHVQVELIAGDRRFATEALAKFGLRLLQKNQCDFVEMPEMSDQESAVDARKRVVIVQSTLEIMLANAEPNTLVLGVGTEVNRVNAGAVQEHHLIVALTGNLATTGLGVLAVNSSPALTPREKNDQIQKQLDTTLEENRRELLPRLAAVARNENVLRAEKLLTATPTWVNLYKVWELVSHDVGERRLRQTFTETVVSRFTHTANHPDGAKEGARHAVSKGQAPASPMTIDEADALIRQMHALWIQEIVE